MARGSSSGATLGAPRSSREHRSGAQRQPFARNLHAWIKAARASHFSKALVPAAPNTPFRTKKDLAGSNPATGKIT
jgi:hypothetical protein